MIEIMPNIMLEDLAIYLKNQDTLIISDTHIGREESMQKSGINIPSSQFQDLKKRLEQILKQQQFKRIVINGDVKHEFTKISDTEWSHTLKIIDLLSNHTKELILIKGNHDNILDPITTKRKNLIVQDYLVLDTILITHGHKILDDFDLGENQDKNKTDSSSKTLKDINTIIIGHEHPAITLSDNLRKETYKCFLKTKYKDKTLITLPSFDQFSIGSNILEQSILSPYLKQSDLNNTEVYIVLKEVMYFGIVKDLQSFSYKP